MQFFTKAMILFCVAILSLTATIHSTTPISPVDNLYLTLQQELNALFPNPSVIQSTISNIVQSQNQQISIAATALYNALITASPLVASGQGELLALQGLGYYSLYLYSAQAFTLGSGFVDYYGNLQTQYTAQNALIDLVRHLDPNAIVSNWTNVIRPTIIQKGLAAPTPPPSANYNNDVLTLIDYQVQELATLDFNDPVQKAAAVALLSTIQAAQQIATAFGNSGVNLQNAFASVLQSNLDEQAALAQIGVISNVLTSVEAAIPGQKAADFYTAIAAIYTDLINFINENGVGDPQAYIDYYNLKRPEFIVAAEG